MQCSVRCRGPRILPAVQTNCFAGNIRITSWDWWGVVICSNFGWLQISGWTRIRVTKNMCALVFLTMRLQYPMTLLLASSWVAVDVDHLHGVGEIYWVGFELVIVMYIGIIQLSLLSTYSTHTSAFEYIWFGTTGLTHWFHIIGINNNI